MKHNPKEYEKKIQARMFEQNIGKAINFIDKPKKYVLVEFPYPSGPGMHIGHARNYTMFDVYSRYFRASGYNVLYPIGWDAFGLPAENYAIKMQKSPQEITKVNIENFLRQLKKLGLSFDWDRVVNTTDPDYYKWTQWIFLQMYKKGLAYKGEAEINWCPKCQTGCAEEEVVAGKHERCGTEVTKKTAKQWILKITDYADRLADDLDGLDFPNGVKISQRTWIGRREWHSIKHQITDREGNQISDISVEVATTRLDTVFGEAFVVIAPEYKDMDSIRSVMLDEINTTIDDYIREYRRKVLEKDMDRGKSGVFTGLYCKNLFTGSIVPLFVSDYVIANVGTGAVMGVPAHDERDFDFAERFSLSVLPVIRSIESSKSDTKDRCFTDKGVLYNSGKYDDLSSDKAIEIMSSKIKDSGIGDKFVTYNIRDWIFSRQRYWGEPIPIVYCDKCGEVPVPEKDLPIKLPDIGSYSNTDDGSSPLSRCDDWVNTKCPKCGGPAKRETDTMPNWAGSNWYYLRYVDPHNKEFIADPELIKYWMPVDIYDGGAEHVTLHLLYSRFWYKFLYDIGVVQNNEPYAARRIHGIVLGEGGVKMSKSLGNVINPEDMVDRYSADIVRAYLLFMGPYELNNSWSENSVQGVARFIDRVWSVLSDKISTIKEDISHIDEAVGILSYEIGLDVENLKFNTAVAKLMKFMNENEKAKWSVKNIRDFLTIISIFTPHVAAELWDVAQFEGDIFYTNWPKKILPTSIDSIEIPIVINGNVRDRINVNKDSTNYDIEAYIENSQQLQDYIAGREYKVVFVPMKIVNIII